MKRFTIGAMFVVVFLGFLVVGRAVGLFDPLTKTEIGGYEKIAFSAVSLEIKEDVNVRAEPIVQYERGDGRTNSYGMLKAGTIFKITQYFRADQEIDPNGNGPFVGFYAEELLNSDAAKQIKSISSDPDGIVWIAIDYVNIQ